MKNLFIFLTLLIAFSIVAFGQKKSDEKTLMDIEQAVVDGVTSGNFNQIEKYYSPEYVITTPEGAVLTAKELLQFLKSGDLKLESSVNSEMKVKIYGSMAIVRYRSADKGTFKGNPITSNNQWTDVFIKKNGKWLLLSSHGTPIQQM